MTAEKVKYSIVVPIYNDGYLASSFCTEFEKVFQKYLKISSIVNKVELIFVNDGSNDNSLELLKETAESHNFVKLIDLSRNFGQHIAVTAGYNESKGTFIGMLNVDMQEHPSEIPNFLNRLSEGDVDIVYGLRKKRADNFFVTTTSWLFNHLINFLTDCNTPVNISSTRFMTRRFIDSYNLLKEKNRFLPGLESWLGFKKDFVEIMHHRRQKGSSSYRFKTRIEMALNSILSFSSFPLKLITFSGILISLFGFLMAIYLVLMKLYIVDYQEGYASIMVTIILIGGIQTTFIGIASHYIGRILTEQLNRPTYIVRERFNF